MSDPQLIRVSPTQSVSESRSQSTPTTPIRGACHPELETHFKTYLDKIIKSFRESRFKGIGGLEKRVSDIYLELMDTFPVYPREGCAKCSVLQRDLKISKSRIGKLENVVREGEIKYELTTISQQSIAKAYEKIQEKLDKTADLLASGRVSSVDGVALTPGTDTYNDLLLAYNNLKSDFANKEDKLKIYAEQIIGLEQKIENYKTQEIIYEKEIREYKLKLELQEQNDKLNEEKHNKIEERVAKLDESIKEISKSIKEYQLNFPNLKQITREEEPVIVIETSEPSGAMQYREALRKNLKNCEYSRPKDVIINRPNKIIMKMKDSKGIAEMLTNLQENEELNKLGTVRLNKKRKFKMILLGIPVGLTEEDLRSELLRDDILSGKEIDIIKIFKGKTDNENAIIALDRESFEQLRVRKRILLDMFRVRIEPYYDIRHCYKCQEFGHISINCKLEQKCAICTGKHETRSCTEAVPRCFRCGDDAHHRSDWSGCPRFLEIKRKLIKNFDGQG